MHGAKRENRSPRPPAMMMTNQSLGLELDLGFMGSFLPAGNPLFCSIRSAGIQSTTAVSYIARANWRSSPPNTGQHLQAL
jgi:hypothetical protein